MNGNCTVCHAFTSINGPEAGSAYNWALARSVAGSPGTSLILLKPSGQCAGQPCGSTTGNATGHGGGIRANWQVGQSGYVAATQWINGGRGALNQPPAIDPFRDLLPADVWTRTALARARLPGDR
jgi:hypothetical protein